MRPAWKRLFVIAGLSLALAACVAAPALAANEIAYECGGRGIDICLLDPANPAAVTNLTDNGNASYDENPIWSPDGSKVAFVSDFTKAGHGERNIFVMEPGAADQAVNLATQITSYSSGAKQIEDLAWSPDGSRIAYTRGNNAGDDSVWVVNADGTTTFPLEIGGPGAKRHPSWSPDSSKIAYAVVKNAPEQIYVASSLGGIGPPLANGVGHEPNWSPDGSRIAFDGYQGGKNFGYVDLHVVNADGSGNPLVVAPSPYTEWTFSAWSPDGGRIAYRATNSEGKSIYRVMNADGGGDHPLATPGPGDDREASWSPDGSRVVYDHGPYGETAIKDLYLANADGSGGAQPLTSGGTGQDPSWRVVLSTPQAPPPHPGAEKPKVVWITKRIFVGGGGPIYVAKVFCSAPSCSVSTTGTAKGAVVAGLRLRPGPKQVVVAKGKTKIPGGQTRKVAIRLNRKGTALLKQRHKATLKVTLKTKLAGDPKVQTSRHTIHLYAKPAKKKKKKG